MLEQEQGGHDKLWWWVRQGSWWVDEWGGGGGQAPWLANGQGFEPCMDDPMPAYCILKYIEKHTKHPQNLKDVLGLRSLIKKIMRELRNWRIFESRRWWCDADLHLQRKRETTGSGSTQTLSSPTRAHSGEEIVVKADCLISHPASPLISCLSRLPFDDFMPATDLRMT